MGEYRLEYLVRREHQFYFRRAVLSQVIPYLNKSEIKVSLQTRQPEIARRRCRSITNVFDRFFEYCNFMTELPPDVVDKIIKDYFAECLKESRFIVTEAVGGDMPGVDRNHELAGTEKFVKLLKMELGTRNFKGGTVGTMEEAVTAAGYTPPPKGRKFYDKLCEGILRARIEQGRIYMAMLSGSYDQIEPIDPLFKAPSETVAGDSQPVGLNVGELAKQFIKLKSGTVWVKKTTADHQRVLDWLQLMVGAELPITSITKGHVEKFRDLMMRVPSNFEIKKKYKDMNILEAAGTALSD